jgi:hypothetical protein
MLVPPFHSAGVGADAPIAELTDINKFSHSATTSGSSFVVTTLFCLRQ